jgi:hypothetical protein
MYLRTSHLSLSFHIYSILVRQLPTLLTSGDLQ